MTNQTIEEAVEERAQKITDLFFEAGARVSRTHYDYVKEALQAQRDAGAREERKKIGVMIEEANYARKVGEKTGDPIAVWEVQDVIRQILALTQPTK